MNKILDTGVKNVRNVLRYTIGEGSMLALPALISERRKTQIQPVVYLIDEFFENKTTPLEVLGCEEGDELVFVPTIDEPTTDYIDTQLEILHSKNITKPSAIVGIGGGITLDVAKAISNLMTNGGKSEHYQGWDLLKKPGIYKVGVPTLSGTGAEATRTCILTNKKTGIKLGMNSNFSVFDQLILDSTLTKTVPINQYFYTGMDAYIHCIESLNGSYRNTIGDSFSSQVIRLCKDVFLSDEIMSDENRSKMMVASYLGGCAIATSYVGVIHPFSAGLSVVLGTHHCLANCITMRAMEEFYPNEYKEFWQFVDKQGIEIPEGICSKLSEQKYEQLFASTIIHEKPLTNALGKDFRKILTKEKVLKIFQKM